MNGDIVARLRDQEEFGLLGVPGDHRSVSYGDAADEIERLREALTVYLGDCDGSCCGEKFRFRSTCGTIARAALSPQTQEPQQ